MPIYEYECGSCGRRFEQLQRITEDALATDPECGGSVRRVIQPVGIIFKGSGFYVNDSRKASSSSSSSDSPKSDGKSESGKAEGKSETKSETKSEGKSDSSSSSGSSSSSKSSESKTAPAAAS
ncbi:MAG: FmdB family zinc ribbon protein [Chloroflexota bacterium]